MSGVLFPNLKPNDVFATVSAAQALDSSTLITTGFYIIETESYNYHFTPNVYNAGTNDIILSDGGGMLVASSGNLLNLNTLGKVNSPHLTITGNNYIIFYDNFTLLDCVIGTYTVAADNAEVGDYVLLSFSSMDAPASASWYISSVDELSITFYGQDPGTVSGQFCVIRTYS